MIDFLKELWMFARSNRRYWLIPLISVMLVLGALLVMTQGSVIAPFIYTLF